MAQKLTEAKIKRIQKLYQKAADLMAQGQLNAAKVTCRKILQINRSDHNAHHMFGLIYKHEHQYIEAIESFKQVIASEKHPNALLEAHLNLLDCLRALEKDKEVMERVIRLLEHYPFEIRLLYLKAKMLDKQGLVQESLECYKQITSFPASDSPINQEIKAYAHLFLQTAPTLPPIKEDIEVIEQLIKQYNHEHALAILHFAQAHGLERMKEYSQALSAFENGNNLFWKTNALIFNQLLADFEKTTQFNWHELSPGSVTEEPALRPIFIEGLPRSGTTLIESVLAESDSVVPCGETPFWLGALEEEARHHNLGFRELIENPNSLICKAVGSNYLNKISAKFEPEKLFVDKTVNTYEYVGIKALAFPQAQFIYTYKNPLDSLFSMYRQNFNLGVHTYSYHPAACAFMVKLSQSYMKFWQKVFPNRIYFYSYEENIERGESGWQSLFNWLNLDWQSEFMQFYDTKREVNTLSSAQVRQEISRKYTNRSEKYGRLLDSFRQFLQMPIEELAQFLSNDGLDSQSKG